MRRFRRRIILMAAVVLLAVTGVAVVLRAQDRTGGRVAPNGAAAWLSPTGSGDACTQSAPCADLGNAIAALPDGGTVYLLGGHYPPQDVQGGGRTAQRTENIVVTPAGGVSDAVLGDVRIDVPRVEFLRVSGDGILYFDDSADYASLVDSHLKGPGNTGATTPAGPSVLIRSDHVTVTGNLIEGGHIHDGINIAGSPRTNFDVTVENNVVRDFSQGRTTQEHADCIQMFDTSQITIRYNRLYDCYNSGITFSRGAGNGIKDVVIESNFIQGCLEQRQRCGQGGAALDLRASLVAGITVTHNTIVNGPARLPGNPGVAASANIVGYLSIQTCSTSLTGSLIADYSTALCKTGLPGTGNVLGTAEFVDPADGDLHLAAPVPAPPSSGPTGRDIDGKPLTTVGASQNPG